MNHSLSQKIDLQILIENYENDFITLIRDRLGILIRHQKKELIKTISDACKKFNRTPENYLNFIRNCPDTAPELEHLITGITIGETYFFRDQNQMRLLQEVVLPHIIKHKQEEENLSLRIWSAGCATGEEIYTIAILLCELISEIKKWKLHLLGTDINTASLQKAINGCYSEWSMRSISSDFKKRYFSKEKEKYILNKKILQMVKFEYLNLQDNNYPSIMTDTNAQDLILCRNVLIYFDTKHITKIMKKLGDSLNEGGYILLGASDPIDLSNTTLAIKPKKATLFYRPIADKLQFIHEPPVKVKVPPIQLPLKTISYDLVNKPIQEVQVNQDNITQLLEEARWHEVLDLIDTYEFKKAKTAFLSEKKAIALANLGKLDKAVKACEDSIALDATNKNTYLLMAMILAELNQFKEAEAALRKTLFLDRQFIVAHFQLGLLLLRNKNREAGLKSLKNALSIAKTKNASQAVLGVKCLNYGGLTKILEREIEVYSA